MKFEDLQKEWDSMEFEPLDHDKVLAIINNNEPREYYMRSVSWREMRQFFLSVALAVLSPVYDLFSLYTPSVGVALAEIENEHMGTAYLLQIPPKDRPHAPLTAAFATMKVVLFLARLVHACLWVAVVLLLIAPVGLEHGIVTALAVLLTSIVFLATWLRSRRWFRKIKTVNELVEEIEKLRELIVRK